MINLPMVHHDRFELESKRFRAAGLLERDSEWLAMRPTENTNEDDRASSLPAKTTSTEGLVRIGRGTKHAPSSTSEAL